MKYISACLLLSIMVIVMGSCKDSVPVPQSPSTSISSTPDIISLAFDGVLMNSAMPQAIYSRTAGILQISGIFNANKGVVLNITDPATGIFSIKNGIATAVFSFDNNSSNVFTGTTGTISISSFTTNSVSGTFEFSGTNADNIAGEVTNGQFLVHVITQ